MSLDFNLMRTGKYDDGESFETEVFWANITHNLNRMADAAGIYDALWRPDENGFERAKDIIPILEKGLFELKDNPEVYEKYNAENGWGLYKNFVPWVQKVLDACKEYPEAVISVSR